MTYQASSTKVTKALFLNTVSIRKPFSVNFSDIRCWSRPAIRAVFWLRGL
jgi:hypothetical protein